MSGVCVGTQYIHAERSKLMHPKPKVTRVIIAGSRHLTDYVFLKKMVDKLYPNLIPLEETIEIVSGGAAGADSLGEQYAREKGYTIKRFPADWGVHGKAAGPIRNRQMAVYADHLIAFPVCDSKGTANMINEANKRGKLTHVFYVPDKELRDAKD
tara:strand:- start:30 stop:494 length:465 start_codon:yes stop_codon:yes gene_type:complete